jgi:quercetin dioxygenase-like cupin family protein
LLFFSCSTTRTNKNGNTSEKRPGVKCMENSPERRGEEGYTILANRTLLGPLSNNLYWHLDRFDSLEAAMKAVGLNSVAAEAHGSFWLMTIEAKTENHIGGHHVAWIGPLVLPATDSFAFRVQSSLLLPGSSTPAHTHPGPEAIYIVDGEQCMQTPKAGIHLSAGQSYVIPDGVIHRGTVIGSKPRRAFGFNLYDATHPTSHDLDKPPRLLSCK